MNKPIREGFIIENEPANEVMPVEVEAAAEMPSPVEEEWPLKVKILHKPIRDNKGNEISELSFRQPTCGDINRYGNPVRIDGNGEIIIDERKMSMLMAGLSGVLLPMLERMDPRDWASCAYRLRSFFLPDPAAW